MIKLIKTIALVMIVIFIGCKKDDFEPVIGLCPIVVSTIPANGATGVALNQDITVYFNTEMNPGTINQESFTLSGPNPVTGVITHTDSTATFNPTSSLQPNTTYTGTVTTLIKDITGNAMQQNHVWSFVTGPTGINFNSLNRFGVFASTGIFNNGSSKIFNMDIGVSNANRSSITGFPPGEIINGAIFAIDDLVPDGVAAMLTQAQVDFANAYQIGAGLNSPARVILTGDQGGRVLIPGIYQSSANQVIQSGNLSLDARGDTDAVWIFQVANDLITQGGSGGNIILLNGAQAKNIFWIIGGSAALGASTIFKGNVLATNSITLNSGANVEGRLFSRNESVSMSTNIINRP